MHSSTLLSVLVAVGACSGAVIYSAHLSNTQESGDGVANVELINENTQLKIELEQLKNENLSLRELAQSNGDIIAPTEIVEFIEKDNNLKFKSSPTIIRANEDEIRKAAEETWTGYFGHDKMMLRGVAFEAIGLVPKQTSFVDQLAIATTGGGATRAIYDYGKDREPVIMVPEDFDMRHHVDSAALVQMMTVALVEQHYPCPEGLSDDAWNCRQALVHANSLITRGYYRTKTARQFQVLGSPVKGTQAMQDAAYIMRALPRYVVELAGGFGALYGSDFFDKKQTSDRKLTLEICLERGTSSKMLISGKEAGQVEFKKEASSELDVELGGLAVLVHAMRGTKVARPLDLVNAYKGDQLSVKSISDTEIEVYWQIAFDDKKSAKLFAQHLKDIRPEAETTLVDDFVHMKEVKKPSQ